MSLLNLAVPLASTAVAAAFVFTWLRDVACRTESVYGMDAGEE